MLQESKVSSRKFWYLNLRAVWPISKMERRIHSVAGLTWWQNNSNALLLYYRLSIQEFQCLCMLFYWHIRSSCLTCRYVYNLLFFWCQSHVGRFDLSLHCSTLCWALQLTLVVLTVCQVFQFCTGSFCSLSASRH